MITQRNFPLSTEEIGPNYFTPSDFFVSTSFFFFESYESFTMISKENNNRLHILNNLSSS